MLSPIACLIWLPRLSYDLFSVDLFLVRKVQVEPGFGLCSNDEGPSPLTCGTVRPPLPDAALMRLVSFVKSLTIWVLPDIQLEVPSF